MNVKSFSSLSRRDFRDGAVIDEIRTALKQRQKLIELLTDLTVEVESLGLVSALSGTIWYNAADYLREIQK